MILEPHPTRLRIEALQPGGSAATSSALAIEELVALLPDDTVFEEADEYRGDIGFRKSVTGEHAAAALTRWGEAARAAVPRLLALVGDARLGRSARLRAGRVAIALSEGALPAVLAFASTGSPEVLDAFIDQGRAGPDAYLVVLRQLLSTDVAVVKAAVGALRSALKKGAAELAAAVRAWLAETPDAVRRLEEARMSADLTAEALACLVEVTAAADALARLVVRSGPDRLDGYRELYPRVSLLSQPAVDALVEVLLRVERKDKVHLAHSMIGKIGRRAAGAAPALVAIVGRDPTYEERRTGSDRAPFEKRRRDAADALAQVVPGGRPYRTELLRILVDSDDLGAELAANVIDPKSVPVEEWLPEVRRGLGNRDGHGETRRRAARALTQFGKEAVAALPELLGAMGVSNTHEQLEPMYLAIEKMGSSAVPALPELFRALDQGPDPRVLAAIAGIGPAARAEAEIVLEVLRAEQLAKIKPQLEDIDRTLAAIRRAPG